MTRHIDDELERNDWHVVVLHYLGLDHIGHLDGPRSLLVQPKLNEMDSVFQHIVNALHQQVFVADMFFCIFVSGESVILASVTLR